MHCVLQDQRAFFVRPEGVAHAKHFSDALPSAAEKPLLESRNSSICSTSSSSSSAEDATSTGGSGGGIQRVAEVDGFRGVGWVGNDELFSNNANEDHPWWFGHAPWHGLHVSDVAMPDFLVSLACQQSKNDGFLRRVVPV